MDRIRDGRRAVPRGATAAWRQAASVGLHGVPALGEIQHAAAKARWLCGRYDCAPIGRHYLQPASGFGGYRAPVYERNDPDDGGTKYRSSLGEPKRSIKS